MAVQLLFLADVIRGLPYTYVYRTVRREPREQDKTHFILFTTNPKQEKLKANTHIPGGDVSNQTRGEGEDKDAEAKDKTYKKNQK